ARRRIRRQGEPAQLLSPVHGNARLHGEGHGALPQAHRGRRPARRQAVPGRLASRRCERRAEGRHQTRRDPGGDTVTGRRLSFTSILTRALPIAALALSPLASGAAEPAKTASAKPATPAKSAPGGSVDRSQPPPMPPAPALSLPTPQTRKLPNGLQVDIVEIHKAPVVHVTVMLRAGAVRDPDDLPGLATFTANMLDEGAGKRSDRKS